MAEENKDTKDIIKEPKTDNSEELDSIKTMLAEIKKSNEELKSKNEELSKENNTLSTSLESINEKINSSDEDKVDLKAEIKKIKEKEQEAMLESEKQKLKEEREKIQQEKLIVDVEKFSNKNPHLKELVNDLITTNDITSMDDLKNRITPTMEENYKLAYKAKQRKKKAGGDPFADYDDSDEMENTKEKKVEGIMNKLLEYDSIAEGMRKEFNIR